MQLEAHEFSVTIEITLYCLYRVIYGSEDQYHLIFFLI